MQRYKFSRVKQGLSYVENIYIFHSSFDMYIPYNKYVINLRNLYFSFMPKKEFT